VYTRTRTDQGRVQNVRFRGRGFREGGGEGAERGTSMRRPRSCAVSSSERAVGNSAVDAMLSASSSCIECVCLCVDDAYACMSACMSCTNTMHRCMCLHIYLYIQMKTRRAGEEGRGIERGRGGG